MVSASFMTGVIMRSSLEHGKGRAIRLVMVSRRGRLKPDTGSFSYSPVGDTCIDKHRKPGMKMGVLPRWQDINTIQDLRQLGAGGGVGSDPDST